MLNTFYFIEQFWKKKAYSNKSGRTRTLVRPTYTGTGFDSWTWRIKHYLNVRPFWMSQLQVSHLSVQSLRHTMAWAVLSLSSRRVNMYSTQPFFWIRGRLVYFAGTWRRQNLIIWRTCPSVMLCQLQWTGQVNTAANASPSLSHTHTFGRHPVRISAAALATLVSHGPSRQSGFLRSLTIHLAQYRGQRQALINTVMNLQVLRKARNLTSWVTISFSNYLLLVISWTQATSAYFPALCNSHRIIILSLRGTLNNLCSWYSSLYVVKQMTRLPECLCGILWLVCTSTCLPERNGGYHKELGTGNRKVQSVTTLTLNSPERRHQAVCRELTVSQSRYSPPFMEPNASLPCSKKPATGPHPEPNAFNPHLPTLSPLRPILTLSSYLRLGLPGGLFPSGFPNKITKHYTGPCTFS